MEKDVHGKDLTPAWSRIDFSQQIPGSPSHEEPF